MTKLSCLFIAACFLVALAAPLAAQDATDNSATTTTTTTASTAAPSSFSIGGINLAGNRGSGNSGRMPFLTSKLNFIRQSLESLRNGTNQIGEGFRNGGNTVAGSGIRSLVSLFFNALRPSQPSAQTATASSSPLDILNPATLLGNLAG